jgi:hypothetical protein
LIQETNSELEMCDFVDPVICPCKNTDTHEDSRGNHIEGTAMVDLISVPTQDVEEVSILLAKLYHVPKHR